MMVPLASSPLTTKTINYSNYRYYCYLHCYTTAHNNDENDSSTCVKLRSRSLSGISVAILNTLHNPRILPLMVLPMH